MDAFEALKQNLTPHAVRCHFVLSVVGKVTADDDSRLLKIHVAGHPSAVFLEIEQDASGKPRIYRHRTPELIGKAVQLEWLIEFLEHHSAAAEQHSQNDTVNLGLWDYLPLSKNSNLRTGSGASCSSCGLTSLYCRCAR